MIRTLALAGIALLAFAAPAFASTVIAKPVHVLAGPGNTFGPLFDLTTNAKVNVMWCGPKGFTWCLISYHRQQGWVQVSSLTTIDANGKPVDNGTPNGPKGSPDDGDEHEVMAMPEEPAKPLPHLTLNPNVVEKVGL